MIFQENDVGTFWLSERERVELCYDKIIEGRTIQRWLKKEELVQKLNEVGMLATGTLTSLQKIAIEKNISLHEENLPKI
jgi:hypothetical protein